MRDREFIEMIEKTAPGTPIRQGLHHILDAGIGALIIVGYGEDVKKVLDGGFFIDCDYTPERIFELSKMDGAIIVDDECKKIIYANVHIQTDRKFSTTESGTRHRTAERVAKQLNRIVIAVSERKKTLNIYKGNMKYTLRDTSELNVSTSQSLKILENYRQVLNKELANLSILELDDLVTLYDVATILQRFEMVNRIKDEIMFYLIEYGVEGRLIDLQVSELTFGLEEEHTDFIKDYINIDLTYEDVKGNLSNLNDKELLEVENFCAALGYPKNYSSLDNKISSKGYRMLSKISKLTKKDIEKLVATYDSIVEILDAPDEDLLGIKISKFKIKALKSGIKRLKVEFELEK